MTSRTRIFGVAGNVRVHLLQHLAFNPGHWHFPGAAAVVEPRITTEALTSPHRKRSLRAKSAVSGGCGMSCSSLLQKAHDPLLHMDRCELHETRKLALLYRVAWKSQSRCQDRRQRLPQGDMGGGWLTKSAQKPGCCGELCRVHPYSCLVAL